MAKYRKKPVVIEATQWFSGEYAREHEWEGGIVRYFRHPNIPGTQVCSKCNHTMHEHGWIDTLEDGHNVCPGDWIITGVQGEKYPIKDEIFRETYEAVDLKEN